MVRAFRAAFAAAAGLARIAGIAALVAGLTSGTAAATGARPAATEHVAFASARQVATWCLAGGTPRANCNGYLMGVTDALRHPAVAAALTAGGTAVCLPPRLAGEQIRNLFLNHLHRNPERGGHAAADAIWSALREAFACPRQPAPEPRRGEPPERISGGDGRPGAHG